jgi:ectoine hydroxylase
MTTMATADRYPSRVAPEPSLTPRRDPVVHGGVDDGPLTAKELDTFEERGFLELADLFSTDEVDRIVAELQRLSGEPTVKASERTIVEPASDEVRSIFQVQTVSELFADVISDPRVADAARQLLGSEVHLHQTRINYKPGLRGKEFFWHSDFETWHVEDGMPTPRAVSASIALTDNHQQNGPLMIMPGSHRTFVACVGETPDEHYKQSLKRQQYGVPDDDSLAALVDRHGIATCTPMAGSVILFDSNCMHGSNGNITPYARSNVFAVYNSVENTLVEPFGVDAARPTFIANRDFTPLPRRERVTAGR